MQGNGDPTGDITVTNIAGSASLSGFKIAPTVTSISPNATTGAAIGDPVTISGSNLRDATVTFNGVAADFERAVGHGQHDRAGGGDHRPPRRHDRRRQRPRGIYRIKPAITGRTPDTAGPGDRFTIAGTNLAGVTSVKVERRRRAVHDDGRLQATVPADATTGPVAGDDVVRRHRDEPTAFTVVSPLEPLSLPLF